MPDRMGILSLKTVRLSSDEELLKLLSNELQRRISTKRGSPEFIAEIQTLPTGLRAMAATYELDVSLALDDLGWHFGNWHNEELAEETIRGLEELGAAELAVIFKEAFQLVLKYWDKLGEESWPQWYHQSPLAKAIEPLNTKAWDHLKKYPNGIFHYWVAYARKHPERLGIAN